MGQFGYQRNVAASEFLHIDRSYGARGSNVPFTFFIMITTIHSSRRRQEINMHRENSFTDSEGRSLTPDLEDSYEFPRDDDAPISPSPSQTPLPTSPHVVVPRPNSSPRFPTSDSNHYNRSKLAKPTPSRTRSSNTPKDRFRTAVHKIMIMHRSATLFAGKRTEVGAEPGVDPRRPSADMLYCGIRQDCVIEITDYSAVRCSAIRMTNAEFSSFMQDLNSKNREPWVKVRWINIGGLSWDVIKTLSMNYGTCCSR